jgi:UDP-N-acetylmuramoyl-tripeptide--D-alanyl-D-alanine ligase
MRFRASDVAAATGGRLIGPDVDLHGAAFDSRTLVPGQLFIPIVDQRDGHEFVDAAVSRGAPAYLSAKGAVGSSSATAIVVPDTLQALMQLAAHRRTTAAATVVGITGSVGKTSTKDLAWTALERSRRTWANERSFNNDQGLPTTVLNAPDDTEVLVLEMGMRGFGEIARLCDIARPTVGVITRVAEAHSDRVGGIDGVARAKAELVEALPVGGTAVLNADDPRVASMASSCAGDVVLVGHHVGAHVRIGDVQLDDRARASFRLGTPWGDVEVRLGISGAHMVGNAAAALALVGVVGGDLVAGAEALHSVQLTAMRMDVSTAVSGAVVVDDSYNANPTSMRAAIDALFALPARRRFAVLGVMAEISDPAIEHRAIHAYAAERGVEVIAVGTDLYGTSPVTDPVGALGPLGDGDAVLVKGSRVAGLERTAESLRTASPDR